MKISFYSALAILTVSAPMLLALGAPAHASWSGPTYTITDRIPSAANTTTTYTPSAGGSPSSANKPQGGTVKATYTWVHDVANDTPPEDVYVVQYGKAEWYMGSPPRANAMTDEPSFQEAVYSSRKAAKLLLVQTQTGSGSASNGLGNVQTVKTNSDLSKVGTSEGYKVVLCHPDANGVLTTPSQVLLASANPGPYPGAPGGMQQYMCIWTCSTQIVNLTFTCNGQDILSPKPAYQTTVGLRNTLVFSMTGPGITITNTVWGLPATRVKDWTHSDTSATIVPFSIPNLFSSTISKLFWVSDGNKDIGVTFIINGISTTIRGNINVTRPTYSFSVAPGGVVRLDALGGGAAMLQAGTPSQTTTVGAGAIYSVSPSPPSPNNILRILQVITNTTRVIKDVNNVSHTWTPTSGLDSFPAFASDSPGQDVYATDKEITMNDSFDVWLMYKPSSAGNEHDDWIYVPLKKLSWSWYGKAIRRGTTGWVATTTVDSTNTTSDLVARTNVQSVSGVDTLVHPTWTGNVPTGKFDPER